MDYTQSIGNVNELQCLTSFVELGYECSIPYGNGAKYDFVVDVNGEFKRIQCKTSHYTNFHKKIDYDAFTFDTTCSTTNTKTTKRYKYSSDQIDYFATHFNGKTYIVPVSECSTSKTLRFSPPKNGQKTYNKAEDYLINKFFEENEQLISSREAYNNRFNKNSE